MSQNPIPDPPCRVRVKICGLTRSEDVREACRLGADALGFVFYPREHGIYHPRRGKHFAVVGNALFGFDEVHGLVSY